MDWNMFLGQPYNDSIIDLHITANGDIVGLGYTQTEHNDTIWKAWMFKISAEGKRIWNKNLGTVEILASVLDSKERIVFSLKDRYAVDSLVPNYQVTAFNQEGTKQWERQFISKGYFYDIDYNSENELLLIGQDWLSILDEKRYLLWDTFTDSLKTNTAGKFSNNKFVASNEDSVNITYNLFERGKDLPINSLPVAKVDSMHTLISIDNPGVILSHEKDATNELIRSLSFDGSMKPERVLNKGFNLSCINVDDKGNILVLVGNGDMSLFSIKPDSF